MKTATETKEDVMLKFYYNGIKDDGGKLQTCFYSIGKLLNHPEGTITIYKREYARFSAGIRAAFTVENDSDSMTDYFEEDRIRVEPSHLLYAEVHAALVKQESRRASRPLNSRKGV